MTVIIIGNSLGFAVSYAINPWIETMGLRNCFITVAIVALGCIFTFLPVVYFGKKWRKASAAKYLESLLQALQLIDGHIGQHAKI